MVLEKKPADTSKYADKTAKTSKDSKSEEATSKETKKDVVVEDEDLVSLPLIFAIRLKIYKSKLL